jgi:phosphoglycolate phosphatase
MNAEKGAPPAVLFDLDGTLVDSLADIAAAVNAALARVGCAGRPFAEIAPHIGEPLAAIFRAWLPAAPPSGIEEACAAYRAHYFDNCDRASRLYPGVIACLERLAPTPLGIATTKATYQAIRVCEAFDLARRFAVIQGCDGIPPKPDPAVVLAALARLGVGTEGAWMVGDTVLDLRAGRAAGCRVCAVTYGIGTREALAAEGPDLLLDDLDALPDLVLGDGR